jgi:arylsulfatase A-like enzyme
MILQTMLLAATAGGVVLVVLAKSLMDFSRTGPQIRAEVEAHYRFYLVYAISRLVFWAWAASFFWILLGAESYRSVLGLFGRAADGFWPAVAGLGVLGLAGALSFCRHLLYKPSFICISWQYRISRLYGLWRILGPSCLQAAGLAFYGLIVSGLAAGIYLALSKGNSAELVLRTGLLSALAAYLGFRRLDETVPAPLKNPAKTAAPNIVMIGCDTLRVDHLGAAGYSRNTSPNLDRLCRSGTLFRRCYAPLARTAPSLASLLGGTWPHQHGIRDNFTAPELACLGEDTLPRLLTRQGYRSAALTDWCGSDLRKFGFGFDEVEAPEDQWNFKYYLRQGPMLLRLFLSLFFNNFIGRKILPELYYQCGNPLETTLGIRTCRKIRELGSRGQPFLLNVFMAGTHAPFGSEYPHYLDFADRNYSGESKFVMTTFRDPNEIAEKQEWGRDLFDLDQILNLYDGCVRKFDEEVERIRSYLEDSGLLDNTILVVYSDHGIEFFENHSWGQGNTVLGDDFGAKIPLIICDPRRPSGRVADQIVRTVDLVPTLLDLAGFDCPNTLAGTSLVPILRDGADLDLPAYQETGYWLGKIPGQHPEHLTYPNLLDLLEVPDKRAGTLAIKPEFLPLLNRAKDRMLRRGRWKLVYQPLRGRVLWRLFDMESDPGCEHDLAAEFPDVVDRLRAEMAPWLRADGFGAAADAVTHLAAAG